MARYISLAILALLIAVLGITFYQVFAPFLVPLFLAALTAFLGQPIFRYFLKRCKERRALAAALSTGTILTGVMLPILVTILLAVLQLVVLAYGTREKFMDAMNRARINATGQVELHDGATPQQPQHDLVAMGVDGLERVCGPDVSWIETELLHSLTQDDVTDIKADASLLRERRARWVEEQLHRLQGIVKQVLMQTIGFMAQGLGYAANLVAAIGALAIASIVYAIALYYFFVDGVELLQAAEALIPMDPQQQRALLAQFAASVRAVVLATFLAAIGQGIATAIGIKVCGIGPFFLILIASTLSALIPMAGTWLVWFPCAAWLAWNNHWLSATLLSIYGIAFVGMLDNVIRTYVLKNETKLHPLLAVVSVFGGIQVMGLWGVFLGPIVACCLHSLLEIFNREVRALSAPSS